MTVPFSADFYARHVVQVAIDLLGTELIRRTREGRTSGIIVEVEAYLAERDPACHASRGRTPGNAAMFGAPGTAYVYPIHGRCCFNVVTEAEGKPSAVLIRAIDPVAGRPLMERRRGNVPARDLARGPARLCQAMAIDRADNQRSLTTGSSLWLARSQQPADELPIACSPRIGVSRAQNRYLRFFLADHAAVSGPGKVSSWRWLRRPPK